LLLEEIVPRIGTTEKYICITRPRRFGKTIMANMLAAYFSKGCGAEDIFSKLKIAECEHYARHLNQYNVIFITLNQVSPQCKSYTQYIGQIEKRLKKDIIQAFPCASVDEEDDIWNILGDIYENENGVKFIFILDEWDYIFHCDFFSDQDKADYLTFLRNLLKDKAYVALAYMTGILPIAKYSSGSELNMVMEYTMTTKEKYSEYFGFTEAEVDTLFEQYQSLQKKPSITREGLRNWYNGYQTSTGIRLYNPRSVVCALSDNQLSGYWTSSGPYDEIYYYINHNIDAVRDDIALMISGIPVPANVSEYAATARNLTTKNEILSAMVVYGFLSYENGCVRIPNKELMDKFDELLMKEPKLGYINKLAAVSDRMLKATLEGDADTMTEILEHAHNTESPLWMYNNENELTAIVNLVYLQARECYRIEREDKAGKGYVDFIFYPEKDKAADCIILELKVDHTAEEALQQIKDRQYRIKLDGYLGEKPRYTGRILGVGIAYDKKTKHHECKIEVLREAIPG
jgi:hypothetical protein